MPCASCTNNHSCPSSKSIPALLYVNRKVRSSKALERHLEELSFLMKLKPFSFQFLLSLWELSAPVFLDVTKPDKWGKFVMPMRGGSGGTLVCYGVPARCANPTTWLGGLGVKCGAVTH